MANASSSSTRRGVAAHLAAFAMPWDVFVGVFLYYVVLTLLILGVANLRATFIGVAYLLPVVLYAGLIAMRGARALAALPIDLGDTPNALQH